MTGLIPVTPPKRLLAGAVSVVLTAAALTSFTGFAHAEAPTAAPQSTAKPEPLTSNQASAVARRTGKPVKADAATSETNELVANADGSFTLTQSVAPVRRYQGGAWKNLDATLVKHKDGTVGPALASTDLVLSGGGSGPLATMKSGAASMSLELPADLVAKLPAPTLDGPSATYALLPGIDLKVTADTFGGFSEVLVIKDAKAAANPALKKLAFKTSTKGVELATDQAGNITAKDKTGKTHFSAPAPEQGIWDSSADNAAATVPDARTGLALDAKTGAPATSSHLEPGAHARVAPIKSEYRDGAIVLTPDQTLLTGKDTVWPVYIDPSYETSSGGSLQNWTYVSSGFPGQSYWRTSDTVGLRVGKNDWEAPYFVARAYAQMSVPSELTGAQLISSTFHATETYAPSCSGRDVELWWTNAINSGTTWNNQASWLSKLNTKNEAHGYSSSCPTAGVGFNSLAAVQAAVGNNANNITLGLRASDESDGYGYKKFQPSTMYMTTTYNHTPNTPSGLSTSPATSCTANPPTVVGNGDVTLYANVSDPDAGGLNNTFTVVKDGTSTVISSGNPWATSGTTSAFLIPRNTLVSAANGAATTFAWNVSSWDGSLTSPTSTTCKFTFDPTSPGAPTITPPANPAYTVGTAATFTFTPNASGSAPSSFLYQLNGEAPVSVAIGTGATTAAIKPTRAVNTLSVTSVSPGGNIGNTAILVFNATAAATAAENDLTGTGRADLAVVGGQVGLPSGYWLSSAASNRSINSAADNIGTKGTGLNAPGSAADWNGTQAITGRYATGTGFNDVLAYNPATGSGSILYGSGDGSPLSPNSGSQVNINSGIFVDGNTGSKTGSVANAGALYQIANQMPGTRPGLLILVNGQLSLSGPASFPGAFQLAANSIPLTTANPTGTGDWTGWTITSSLVNNTPALFARNAANGQVWYYSPTVLTNLATAAILGTDNGPTAPVKVSDGLTAAAFPVLQAADINRDGTVDLWSVAPNGIVTARLFNGTTLTAQTSQTLTPPTHEWPLGEGGTEGSQVGSTADLAGNLTLTGTAGATWSNRGMFNPNVHLNAGPTSALGATGPAVNASADFSASVWVNAENYSGVVLSQDGNNTARFMISGDGATKQWQFCMAKQDSGWDYDCVRGNGSQNEIRLGVWAHIGATYNATTKVMALYVNGINVNTTSHNPVAGTDRAFRVGDYLNYGTRQEHFTGAVSDVRTWAGTTLGADQMAMLSGTPGYVLFPSDDTNYPSGSTWSTTHSTMTFKDGVLTIRTVTGATSTAGKAGYPNAVLTLQTDGNLVIYPNAAHTDGTALWASDTYFHSGASMFLQPDGNLVIYGYDGQSLWNTGTWN
ncbi:hypothetical protein [Kitasatospora griseola]|uniref:hypothetical protein n=1 Tax=Kitasatospora griseola TaxID=2064 RepID=UPI003663B4EE